MFVGYMFNKVCVVEITVQMVLSKEPTERDVRCMGHCLGERSTNLNICLRLKRLYRGRGFGGGV